MDKLTTEQRRKNMQAVRCSGSKIERLLAQSLWNNGLRYRKNDRSIVGKPDFSFRGKRVAVFVDSEFWHGKNWDIRRNDFKSNKDFWVKKIEKNIERDVYVNETLQSEGWIVIRFWGNEITSNVENCMLKVKEELHARKR